jgi:hypothetical protein
MAVKPGAYYEIKGHEFNTVAAYNVRRHTEGGANRTLISA